MKLRKNKKGFTIVELVIVIAVIGVLAAVLIPTFINLNNKANKAADESLVKNLNTALATQEQMLGDKPNDTMNDAVGDLKDYGYLLQNLVTKSEDKLLWNRNTNRFLLEKDVVINSENKKTDYWRIQDNLNEQEYSVYAGIGFEATTVENLKVGFDAGDKTDISSISYVGGESAQDVVIRTNSASTTLTINAPADTVNHYGAVGTVNVTAIDMNCYNELGEAAYVKVTEGKVVAKNGGKIDVVFANNTDGSKVAVVKETSGEIVEGYTTVETVHTSNLARNGGIALTYNKPETEITEIAETAVDKAQEKEVVANQKENDVLYQARIGTKGFETIKDAIETALDGDKIVLMSDLTRGINHSSSANKFAATRNPGYPITYKDAVITIDFNGHSINDGGLCCFPTPDSNQTIIYKNSGESESVYEHESSTTPIGNGGNSIVNGGTFIAHRENNMDTLIGCSNGCSTIINNGTFRAPLVEPVNTYPGQSYNQYSAVAVIRIGYGEITINGGDFTGNIVKAKFGDGVLTINGGTFHNFRIIATPGEGNSQQTVAIQGGSFDADPSEYVVSGYHANNNGNGTWTVVAD